jgi:hypothetical protein
MPDEIEEEGTEVRPAPREEEPNPVQFMARKVGPWLATLAVVYVIAVAMGLLVALVRLWRAASPFTEADLLLVVILSGALGGMVHALRSLSWYIGNRDLVRSWLAMYVLLPFVGAVLGLVFYLVVRGGFFSPQAGAEETSPYGFAALAALVGLFSEQAVLKLKQVAETLLSKTQKGEDHAAAKDSEDG